MTKSPAGQDTKAKQVEVITTHVNADYDALASMLAAAKLYPEAMLVLPGAQERNLRNFFVESTCYLYNFVKVKNVPLKDVTRLILVDTRQSDRIGPLAQVLKNPGLSVHAYDHHPDSDSDVKTDFQVVRPWGATVTVISHILEEKGITLGEDEATLLALGIYEDTGSFSFVSTTEHDFKSAAWLLKQGAKLGIVSSLITRELTSEEVAVLNDLISQSTKYNINGVDVVVSEVSRPSYVPEFAVLVHKFMDMDNLDALFALARMEGKLYLVARSRLPAVDVGLITGSFGGGGHATAASASLKEMTMVEARNRLLAVLQTRINPSRTAGDIMTPSVVSITPGTSMQDAHHVFTRYSLNVVPVIEDGKVLGIIGNDLVEKALFHGLGSQPVGDYLDDQVPSLTAEASLAEVEQAIVGHGQRLIPIMQGGGLAGVVTRTDLLNELIQTPLIPERYKESDTEGQNGHYKKVKGLMKEHFPARVTSVLTDLGKVADAMGAGIYLVGGSVRDLMLRRRNLDLDVVVEGDGTFFAKRYAESRQGVRCRAHQKFKTAKLFFPDDIVVDVATARMEYYQAPAALPIVELSSLKMDLYRRDFTINTLAVNLSPKGYGELLNFFDGVRDLKDKTIRVLHNLSFVEDPTRVFRAVRFEQRYGFRIGKLTEGLIKNALRVNVFKDLSGSRLFSEIKLLLKEEKAASCLLRLNELNLLQVLHPELTLHENKRDLVRSTGEALAWYRLSFLDRPIRQWLVYLLALSDDFEDDQMLNLCGRLSLAPKLRREILEKRKAATSALNRLQRKKPAPSLIQQALEGMQPAYQMYIMAKAKRDWVKKAVSLYLTQLMHVSTALTGSDLKDMGFTAGPLFQAILNRVLAARLDGEVSSKEEETALVLAEFTPDQAKDRN